MYEPIRTKSVHTTAAPTLPRRSRDEELDLQLAGHLAALLTVTDELRALESSPELDRAAEQLAEAVTGLHRGRPPLRLSPAAPAGRASAEAARVAALHRRARALAGRALVVAESRQNAEAAALAERHIAVHTAAA
ncbi:SCO4983 family protein [Streptomyces sp. NPDC001070]